MYYIIQIAKNEYLSSYDLGNKKIEVTPMENEAWQFVLKSTAEWVADRVGGTVLEIKYTDSERE